MNIIFNLENPNIALKIWERERERSFGRGRENRVVVLLRSDCTFHFYFYFLEWLYIFLDHTSPFVYIKWLNYDLKNQYEHWFGQIGLVNLNYKPLFVKKLKRVCSLKRSLYGGRELLSELGSWLSSFIYECERRKRVCKWVRVWAFIYTWKMIILRSKYVRE